MILVGDIGGTNSRLAFVETRAAPPQIAFERNFPSGEFTSLEHILHVLLAEARLPFERACIAIAGPIRNQRCEATNLPWVIDAREISRSLGGRAVLLINDLEAIAYGLSVLPPEDFRVLNPGSPGGAGNACVIAAGTGLGEAGIYWDGSRHRPFAGEGGHTSFAPVNALQMELHKYLNRQYEHVSWERVLSGPGLLNIYHFLRDTRGGEEPAWLAEQMRTGDPPAVISRAALEGKSELCEQALDLFVTFYGQEAGNAALKFLATGGVYIGGGIAPHILPRLQGPLFMGAFLAKGRMRPLLESMPVRVILNRKAGLIGAAVCVAAQS